MVKTLEDHSDVSGSVKKGTLMVAFEKTEGPNKTTIYHCEGKHGKVRLHMGRAHVCVCVCVCLKWRDLAATTLDSLIEPCPSCKREAL